MKKIIFAATTLVVLVFSSFRPGEEWIKYTSVEGRYTLKFPGQPVESVKIDTNSDGTIFTIHMATYEASTNEVFLSSFTDMSAIYPDKSLKQILEDSRDGAANSLGATKVETNATVLDKDPYIEFTFSSDQFVGKDRIYMIGKVQYSVISLSSVNNGLSHDADKFLTSFKHAK